MGSRTTEIDDQSTVDGTPEDVAALYSWAKLQGAKYRDYSASRREYRAQVRYRAAKILLERELAAHVEAEAFAARAERASWDVQASQYAQDELHGLASPRLSQPDNQEAARLASAERLEVARRAESAARAGVLALREEREIAEAHSSALHQATIYEQSELRRRQLAGPQPNGLLAAPYSSATAGQNDRRDGPGNLQQLLQPGSRKSIKTSTTPFAPETPPPTEIPLLAQTAEPESSGSSAGITGVLSEDESSTPAWLNATPPAERAPALQGIPQAYKGDAAGRATLQDSRERVAARWFALKEIFQDAGPELPARPSLRPADGKTPLLAVFSLAGGVGKTSLVAALGRSLASLGEKVTLADTTSQGLLEIYFGSRNNRVSALRLVPPATEGSDPPISLVLHDLAGITQDERQRNTLTDEILRSREGNHRLLLDLSTGSSWLIKRLASLHPIVLIPIAPDMNSVISLQAVERLFRAFADSEGRPLLPYYVLNQFDASLPLHLDVREVFRRQLGDRLLRFAIRRSQVVSESLADGMTVLDYAPDAPVSQDYRDIAMWLRDVSPPATEEFRQMRWGNR